MTPLHFAARQGRDDELRRLLASGIPVDAHCSRDRETALHEAASSPRAHTSTLQILLDAGANIHAKTDLDRSPLHEARGLEKKKLLIEAGADPLYVSDGGYSALYFTDDPEEIEYLLGLGVDINMRSHWGETCLNAAALWGGPDRVRFLLAKGADPKAAYWSDLHTAVVQGDYDEVQKRLAAGDDPLDVEGSFWSAWHFCVRQGDPAMAELFVRSGIGVNALMERGFQPLIVACESAPIEMVQWLISMGADINQSDDREITPLTSAVARGDIEIVQFLLEQGANLKVENDAGDPIITYASDLDVIRLLISLGENINCADGCGETLLCRAISDGDLEQVRTLVVLGADPNFETYNPSFLMVAAACNELEIARFLLDAGADAKYRDCDGDTVLSRLYSAEMAQMMLDSGADRSAVDIVNRRVIDRTIWPEVGEVLGLDISSCATNGVEAAAIVADLELARYFQSLGGDASQITEWALPALFDAAESNDIATIELLLQENVDPLQVDSHGNNLLHYACGLQDVGCGLGISPLPAGATVIERLLEVGVSPSAVNIEGQTPLMIAAMAYRLPYIAVLAKIATEAELAEARRFARERFKDPYLANVLAEMPPPED